MNTQKTRKAQEELELPLHQHITAVLSNGGHTRPGDWLHHLPQEVQNNAVDPEQQRFHINQFWRRQLGNCQEDTMDARFCLVDQGSYRDWLSLFEAKVAPCIIRNNLPPAFH